MINVHFKRTDMADSVIERQESPFEALASLLVTQLGYGGHVQEVSPERVIASVPVLFTSAQDVATFTGDAKEMELLVQACTLHAELNKVHGERLASTIVEKMKATNTKLSTAIAGLLAGAKTSRLVYVVLLGEQALTHLDKLIKIELADLADIFTLTREGTALEEVLMMC